MNLAYEYGADHIWIVDVGDLVDGVSCRVSHSGLESKSLAQGSHRRLHAHVGQARIWFGIRNGNCAHNLWVYKLNGAGKAKSTHVVEDIGYNVLKFWMVDPGVVLQTLIVNTGGVKPSYLGPPESFDSLQTNTAR